ncbi:MAG: hypothetical protein N2376_07040 [Clostridia bacterium]|nr:hypothetical protein [Clostridia bacterium]
MRSKRSFANITLSLTSQLVVILVGFIVPRFIILHYGSPVNGLVLSLQQVMTYFMLVESGILGASVFALYKPLAEKDYTRVSEILSHSSRSFNRAGTYFVGLLAIASVVYPMVVKTPITFLETSILIFAIGANGATSLYGIGKYKALLTSDQHIGIVDSLNAMVTILYTLIIIVLAQLGVPVFLVYTAASLAYSLRFILLRQYCKRKYPQIGFRSETEKHAIPNQRDVFLQQILGLIVFNFATILITFQLGLTAVSIYSIYNLVAMAILLLMGSVNNGISAGMGDAIARNQKDVIAAAYKEFIFISMLILSWVGACLTVLYRPFIKVYVKGVSDAAYLDNTLVILFTVFILISAMRNQGGMMMTVAGQYKCIRLGSIIEVILAVGLSIAGGFVWGLSGVVAGRVIATFYRWIDFGLKTKAITGVPSRFLWKRALIMVIGALTASGLFSFLFQTNIQSLKDFFIQAILVVPFNFFVAAAVFVALDYRLSRRFLKRALHMIRSKG